MDTPTLLLVLVGVVLILLDQHRRAQKREAIRQGETRAARAEVSTPPTVQLEAPATEPAPAIVVVAENPDSAKPERKKKRRPLLAAESVSSSAKPMPGVLGLLKQRDALASAFVLSEILDVPLSRRRARTRGRR